MDLGKSGQFLSILSLFLRFLSIPFSAASLWMMTTNKQSDEFYGPVEFSNLSGLIYLVIISAISLGYALASMLLSILKFIYSDWLLFILDQVVAYLMVTSGSVVADLLYLAREGEQMVTWSEVCSFYGHFCYRMKVSLALHFVSLACFIALSVTSAFRVFSKLEGPAPISSKGVEVEEQEGE